MKKFYKKSEIWFAITWIIIYVIVMGTLRNNLGDESLYSTIGLLVIAGILTIFIVKNKLRKKYGLINNLSERKKYLYYIPFVLLCSVNLWVGVSLHFDFINQIIAVFNMALVGYIEEIIFRGFLYKAIEKESINKAIIISAVTFGMGHIVNLLTGQVSLDVFLQIGYAIAIGFSFVIFFYKSESLIPCIITHSFINMSSKFSNYISLSEHTQLILNYVGSAFIIVVAGGYAWYLYKKVKGVSKIK